MILCAGELKDSSVRPDREHVKAFKKEMEAHFKKLGLECVVGVQARDLDNMVITLKFPGNGISARTLEMMLERGFRSPYRCVPVCVVGA